MTPQTQSRIGPTGRCLEACIASILNIAESDVPEFGGDDVYLHNIAEFLNAFGLYYCQAMPGDPVIQEMFRVGTTYHLIEGMSPRGGLHACVGCNGQIIFDPHPQDGTGRGLVRIDCFGLLCARMS